MKKTKRATIKIFKLQRLYPLLIFTKWEVNDQEEQKNTPGKNVLKNYLKGNQTKLAVVAMLLITIVF